MSSEHEPALTVLVQSPKTDSPTPTHVISGAPNGISPVGTSRAELNGIVENGTSVNGIGTGVNGIVISIPPAPAEDPPPYSEEPRRSRRLTRSTVDTDDSDEDQDPTLTSTEATPLLNGRASRRRRRAASYSTIASFSGVDFRGLVFGIPSTSNSTSGRSQYFAPLSRRAYWRALLHLTVINFPFALAAWVLLFCGVVLGTTLLITLPFGVVFWFLTLFLSRSFARAELHLQSTFHRPLRVAPADPPRPIFYRPRPAEDIERALIEPGTEVDIDPTIETSFLKNSYSMFMDPSSFQPIFYFLVVKASITLVVTPLVLALAPVCLVLVLPAPIMLRIVRRVGAWQANLAIEALS
ncbi:transmembrane protein [Ceratobasidium sp. AG-Ba]|nr:transmembrane protein [Ceratobasidium sp. AG-Ba]